MLAVQFVQILNAFLRGLLRSKLLKSKWGDYVSHFS